MAEFTKLKIGFALALLGTLFALHPLLDRTPDLGFRYLGYRLEVLHAYALTSGLLGLCVYLYAVTLLNDHPHSWSERAGNAIYSLAILVLPIYVGLFLSALLAERVAVSHVAWAAPAVAVGLGSGWVILSQVVAWRIRHRLGERDRASRMEQLARREAESLAQANELLGGDHYDLCVVEAWRALDQPPSGLDSILKDDHPAISHFSTPQRAEVRKGLATVPVSRLGGIMMGSVPTSNLVYNAAANVAISLLGGPAGATRSIRDRDPAFAPIAVRRYMLTDRKANGDNEATPAALAAVLQRLSLRRFPGVADATVEDIRRAILAKDDPRRGRIFFKEGDLASDPITCVCSGWCEKPGGGAVVFVVMLAGDEPGAGTRDESHRELAATAGRLVETLLEHPGKGAR